MIHSMNIDDKGHKNGSESSQYRNAVRNVDGILSNFVPRWIEEGYTIIVTSDHGMSYDGNHSGSAEEETEVPFWLINSSEMVEAIDPIPQVKITEIMRKILNI